MPRAEFYSKYRETAIRCATEWNRSNPERRATIQRTYVLSPLGKASRLRYKRSRRAAHRLARPAWRDQAAIDALYTQAEQLGLHVDHIVPLRHQLVCGLHAENNLRLIYPTENQKKGNRWWPDMPQGERKLADLIELVDP